MTVVHDMAQADVQEGTECHHIVVEDWDKMPDSRGCLFVSIPSLLDSSLAPDGCHTFHAFAPEFVSEYAGLSRKEYKERKEAHADEIIDRLEAAAFPGLRDAIVFREVRPVPPPSCGCFLSVAAGMISVPPGRFSLRAGAQPPTHTAGERV